MNAEVVNIRNSDYDCYCGRGGIWGNPFFIGKDGTREEVIAKHREWIKTQPGLLALIPTLKGKRLGCYCRPLTCHCDTLAELANALPEAPPAPKPEPLCQPGIFPALPPPAPKMRSPKVFDLSSGTKLDIRNL